MPETDPWYTQAFRADYLERYAHRDEGEAGLFVQSVIAPLLRGGTGGKPVLDLCAGACRHSIAIAALGARVVAYDLSAELLAAGRRRMQPSQAVALVRGDMRALPFPAGAFGLVLNAFTAFGYFDADDENLLVLGEVARVLAPGGRFVLDFANREPIVRRLGTGGREGIVPRAGAAAVREVRRMTGDLRRVERVRLPPDGHGGRGDVLESVRLYSPPELRAMLASVGLSVEGEVGDYTGGAFDPEVSERIVLIARKGPEAREGGDPGA